MAFAPAELIVHRARKIDIDGEHSDAWIAVSNGRITAVGIGEGWREGAGPHTEVVDAAGDRVSPGLIDLHVHGGGGGAIDDGAAAAVTAVAAHRAHGTTRTLLSFVSAPIPELIDRLRWAADLTAHDSTVLGVHLEGPFLAAKRAGAHRLDALRVPDARSVSTLIDAANGVLKQVTIAPELPGALDAISVFSAAGVLPAIGHTTADFDVTQRAFDAGARLLTHAFNAMPGLGHRDPGPVAAAFERPEVALELVLDGVHLDSRIAALAFALAPGRIALVTDAMAAAAAGDGTYALGRQEVTVAEGIARIAGTATIAGSTLTLDAAIRRAVSDAHCTPSAAVAAATMVPARLLGLDRPAGDLRLGALRPGFTADLVRFDRGWKVRDVWVAGERQRALPETTPRQ